VIRTLALTAPIYGVIALGYLAVRQGVFERRDIAVLGTYVLRVALPAMVFTALSQRSSADLANVRYLVDYTAGSLAVMAAAFAWGWWRQGKDVSLSALCGLGMSSSNSAFIGYPIAAQVVGHGPATLGLAMCMLIENLLVMPLGLLVADSGQAGHGPWTRILGASLAQMARNPIMIAIVAGFGTALAGLPLPGPLTMTVDILARSSTAVSLFVIGGSLFDLQVAGMRRDVTAIALGKLLLHPAAVATLIWLLPPDDPALRHAAVIYAGVPMLSIYPILAQKYGHQGLCAAALLLTTVLSFGTISAGLWLMGRSGGI
jgi:predicted permease